MNARTLTRMLVGHAGVVLRKIDPEMGRAMAVEAEHIAEPGEGLRFAGGCVAAAYRRRLSGVTLAVIAARLSIAAAAAAFGLLHIAIPAANLCLKLELANGAPGLCTARATAFQLQYVGATSLSHWVWHLAVLGGLGLLHVLAALALAGGWTRGVYRLSVAIAAMALATPFLGAGALTLPPIYVLLIGAMSLSAFLLHRACRWEARRLAGTPRSGGSG